MPTRTKVLGHVRVDRRRLSAQPGVDSVRRQPSTAKRTSPAAIGAFVVVKGHDLAVTIDAESELGEVIGTDGEAVEALGELTDQEHVVRDLAHRVHLEPVLAALQTELGHRLENQVRLGNSAHERDMSTTFVRPICSRTRFIARHASAKPSA